MRSDDPPKRNIWALDDIGSDELVRLARRAHLISEMRRTQPKRVVRRRNVALSQRVGAIRDARSNGNAIPAGRLLGLPELADDCWVDIGGAAAIVFAQPNTITAWLARGGPKRNPFPDPNRILGRLFWPMSDLVAWSKRGPADSATTAK